MDSFITDDLLDAVREQESNNGQNVVSKAGALGPYQFMPAVWHSLKKQGKIPAKANIMNEDDSRNAAKVLLEELSNHYKGDPELTLAGYNLGQPSLDAWLAKTKDRSFASASALQDFPTETKNYVPGVLDKQKKNYPTETARAEQAPASNHVVAGFGELDESDFGLGSVDLFHAKPAYANDDPNPTPDTPADNGDAEFQDWYSRMSKANGLNPNPNDPKHQYNWKGYWEDNIKGKPEMANFFGTPQEDHAGQRRFPDEYKTEDYDQESHDNPEAIQHWKDNQVAKIQLPTADVPRADTSLEGFQDGMHQLLTSPQWPMLKPEDQINAVNKLVKSKAWDSNVYPHIQKTVTNIWDTVDSEPDFNALVDTFGGLPPLPNDTKDPEGALKQWEGNLRQAMDHAGIIPEIYGDQFNNWLQKSKDTELEALNNRRRGPFMQGLRDATALTGVATRGVFEALGSLPAAVARYEPLTMISPSIREGSEPIAQAFEQAARDIPESVFGNVDEKLAQTDAQGYPIQTPDGQVVPKYPNAQKMVGLAGQIAGMFGIGGVTKMFTAAGSMTQVAASIGSNAAIGMNMAFHEAKEEGATDDQAWKTGLLALPLGVVPQAVVSHFAMSGLSPIVIGMTKSEQAAAIAAWATKKGIATTLGKVAAVEGTAMTVQQLGQSSAASIILGRNVITASKLADAFIAGAAGGAAGRAMNMPSELQGYRKYLEALKDNPPPKNGTQTTIPAAQPNAQGTPVVVVPSLSEEEKVKLGSSVSAFLNNPDAQQINLSTAEAFALADEVPHLFEKENGITISQPDESGGYVLRKTSSYTNLDSTELQGVRESINSVVKYINDHPSTDEEIHQTVNDYTKVSQDLKRQAPEGSPERAYLDRYMALRRKYENAQAELEQTDPSSPRYKVLKAAAKQYGEEAVEYGKLRQSRKDWDTLKKLQSDAKAARQALNLATPEERADLEKIVVQKENEASEYQNTKKPNDPDAWDRLVKMYDKYLRLKPRYQLISDGANSSYPTKRSLSAIKLDRQMAEKNLAFLLKKQEALFRESVAKQRHDATDTDELHRMYLEDHGITSPAAFSPKNGVLVNGKPIFEVNGKWVVADGKDQRIFESFKDASRSTDEIKLEEPPVEQPVAAQGEAPTTSGSAIPETAEASPQESPRATTPGELLARSKGRRYLNRAKTPDTDKYVNPVDPLNPDKTVRFAENDDTANLSPRDLMNMFRKVAKSFIDTMPVIEHAVMPDRFLGLFKHITEQIRLKNYDDIQTAGHELGHAITQRLMGPNSDESVFRQSAVGDVLPAAHDQGARFYATDVPKGSETHEGMAMFFEHWFTGQPVRREMLDWFNHDFGSKYPQLKANLEEFRSKMFEWYNKTPRAATDVQIVNPPTRAEKVLSKASLGVTDSTNWIRAFYDRATLLHDLGNRVHDWFEAVAHIGRPTTDSFFREDSTPHDINGNKIPGVKSFGDIFKAAGEHVHDLSKALSLRRQIALFQQGIKPSINFEDAVKSYSALLDKVRTEGGDLVPLMHDFYNTVLAWNSVVGGIHEGAAYRIQKMQEHNLETTGARHGFYVPSAIEGHSSVNVMKKIQGGAGRPVVDFRHVMQAGFTNEINATIKQSNLYRLAEVAQSDYGNELAHHVRAITDPQEAQAFQQAANRHLADAMKLDQVEDTPLNRLVSAVANPTIDSPVNKRFKAFSIVVRDANTGKVKTHWFEMSPEVHDALDRTMPDWANHPIMRYTMLQAARVFRPAATTFQVPFAVANIIRRPWMGAEYLASEGRITNFRDLARYVGYNLESLFKDQLLGFKKDPGGHTAVYKRLGLMGATLLGEENRMVQSLKGPPGRLLDKADATFSRLAEILGSPDIAARTAAMRFAMDKLGITDPNAQLTTSQALELRTIALNSTINYSRKGSILGPWSMITPFMSARVAHMARPWQLVANAKPGAQMLYGSMATALVGSVFHALANADKKWYQETSLYDRMRAIWFDHNVDGVSRIFGIRPDETTKAMWGLGQIIGGMMYHSPTDAMKTDWTKLAQAYIGENFLPVASWTELAGIIPREILSQQANYDYYFHRPIVPDSQRYMDPTQQFNEYTSELAKKVGAITGTSPNRWDHAIQNTVPAFASAERYGEKVLGLRNATKDTGSLNFFVNALGRGVPAEGVADRAMDEFQTQLMKHRANEFRETPQDKKVREALEELNRDVSNVTAVTRGITDVERRSELRAMRRELLETGVRIANGERLRVPRDVLEGEAEKYRRLQKIERKALALKDESTRGASE